MLEHNDLHALRRLVNAHLKRRRKSLERFKRVPGQSEAASEAAYENIQQSIAFYEGLLKRVRDAEDNLHTLPDRIDRIVVHALAQQHNSYMSGPEPDSEEVTDRIIAEIPILIIK